VQKGRPMQASSIQALVLFWDQAGIGSSYSWLRVTP
jgi:hypothetical protein